MHSKCKLPLLQLKGHLVFQRTRGKMVLAEVEMCHKDFRRSTYSIMFTSAHKGLPFLIIKQTLRRATRSNECVMDAKFGGAGLDMTGKQKFGGLAHFAENTENSTDI